MAPQIFGLGRNFGFRISDCGFIFGFRIWGFRSPKSAIRNLFQSQIRNLAKSSNPKSANKSAIRNPKSEISSLLHAVEGASNGPLVKLKKTLCFVTRELCPHHDDCHPQIVSRFLDTRTEASGPIPVSSARIAQARRSSFSLVAFRLDIRLL